MRLTRFLAMAALVFLAAGGASAEPADRPANAVTLFGAKLTGNDWQDFFTPSDLRFRDTYLAGAGLSHRLATFFDALDIEVLGQAALHFGHAHQWEFDAALVARWTAFPWNDLLRSSVAFGFGPSVETRRPPEERNASGQSEAWLGFWVLELTAGPPDSLWSAVIRVHHRSTAYGLFGKSAGSNWLALGVRRDF